MRVVCAKHVKPDMWIVTTDEFNYIIIIIIIITYLHTYFTAIDFSLSGSSPYTSTDKTNNIHKWNNTKTSHLSTWIFDIWCVSEDWTDDTFYLSFTYFS